VVKDTAPRSVLAGLGVGIGLRVAFFVSVAFQVSADVSSGVRVFVPPIRRFLGIIIREELGPQQINLKIFGERRIVRNRIFYYCSAQVMGDFVAQTSAATLLFGYDARGGSVPICPGWR